jgi:hypothetical protein
MTSRAFHLSINKVKREPHLKSMSIFVCERDLFIPFSKYAYAEKNRFYTRTQFLKSFYSTQLKLSMNSKKDFSRLIILVTRNNPVSFRASLEVPDLLASYSRYKRIIPST